MKALQHRRQKDTAPAVVPARGEWREVYEHVSIPVRAEWMLTDLPLREVASLHVGDVLELPVGIIERTRVLLSGTPKFSGTVGIEGDLVAVKLNRKLTAADEDRS